MLQHQIIGGYDQRSALNRQRKSNFLSRPRRHRNLVLWCLRIVWNDVPENVVGLTEAIKSRLPNRRFRLSNGNAHNRLRYQWRRRLNGDKSIYL